jgi:glycosyltransferase involved in cell wall biosynthesis
VTEARAAPLVSVLVEGYNEVQLSTSVEDTLEGLLRQDYPLDRIEVLLLGSTEDQVRRWVSIGGQELPFARVVAVDAEGLPYYALKNRGARQATGEIFAFTDSDVVPDPSWVPSMVDAIARGADVTCGVSRVRARSRPGAPRPVLDVAGSVCFGHTVAHDGAAELPDAPGLVAHNFGARADTFRSHQFDTSEFGRNLGPMQIYEDVRNAGGRVAFVRGQSAAHSISMSRWFFYPFMVRVGYEEHIARRAVPTTHSRWLMRTGPFEPVLTMLYAVAWDVHSWSAYGRALGLGPVGRWARVPLLLAISIPARLAGMIGGFGAMLAPRRMKAWAEAH